MPQQVLPVAADSGPPPRLGVPATSALEYLRQVRHEAQMLPASRVAPESYSSGPPAISAEDGAAASYNPGDAAVTPMMRRISADFSFLRHRISRWTARAQGRRTDDCTVLPPVADWQGWRRVVQGQESGAGHSGPIRPTLSLLARFCQADIIALLELHRSWLEEQALETSVVATDSVDDPENMQGLQGLRSQLFLLQQGEWIFSLLARLDRLLDADRAACLRDIGRSCLRLRRRAQTEHSAEVERRLNPIIAVICVYFEQYDLLAETL